MALMPRRLQGGPENEVSSRFAGQDLRTEAQACRSVCPSRCPNAHHSLTGPWGSFPGGPTWHSFLPARICKAATRPLPCTWETPGDRIEPCSRYTPEGISAQRSRAVASEAGSGLRTQPSPLGEGRMLEVRVAQWWHLPVTHPNVPCPLRHLSSCRPPPCHLG